MIVNISAIIAMFLAAPSASPLSIFCAIASAVGGNTGRLLDARPQIPHDTTPG
jgi:hypothetical protein